MSEYQVFRENYDGKGKWLIVAAFMNQVGRVLNNIRGFGGVQAYVHQNGIDIRGGGGGGGAFSGFVYVYGKKFDVTEYRGPRLRVVKGHGTSVTVTRTKLPMPDPMPANESWRNLDQCSGDIYIDC